MSVRLTHLGQRFLKSHLGSQSCKRADVDREFYSRVLSAGVGLQCFCTRSGSCFAVSTVNHLSTRVVPLLFVEGGSRALCEYI